jgi:hypothetical protein
LAVLELILVDFAVILIISALIFNLLFSRILIKSGNKWLKMVVWTEEA